MHVIGFAGELSPLKGVDALPSEQRAQVVLTGAITPREMPDFYRGVDVLIVPSRTEAQSRVTLEAMLAGVIVLASVTCGSTDLIADGKTGMLVRPEDPASVGTALAMLAADPGRAQAIRKQAASFAASLATDSCSRWRRLLILKLRR